MTGSLRALLGGALDDAALFPPAELPLAQAVRNDIEHRGGPDGWLLGRFVCPTARLADLAPLLPKAVTPLSVVLRTAPDLAGFRANFAEDVQSVQAFAEHTSDRAAVESLEVALPTEPLSNGDRDRLGDCLRAMRDAVEKAGLQEVTLFCEVGGESPQPDRARSTVIELLADGEHPPRWAFKLRTGGRSVPSPEQVAAVVTACRDAGLAWKATAGLHHPTTRREAGHYEFGFLNLFAAAVLADAHQLDAPTVARILTEPAALRFDDDGLAWDKLRAKAGQIEAARQRGLQSFGSCSFTEPRDGLHSIGLM
jgi:hypothetical protein